MDAITWDYSMFWSEAIDQLHHEISEQEWVMWFNNLEYARSDQSKIMVHVPSSFYRDQVKQRYLGKIESKLAELAGDRIEVDFTVRSTNRSKPL